MTKVLLLLLAAATLLCCVAAARESCDCIRYSTNPVHRRLIRKIEVVPAAGRCRRTEIIITLKSGKVFCTKPGALWIDELLKRLQETSKATVAAAASTSTEPTS